MQSKVGGAAGGALTETETNPRPITNTTQVIMN
jgi:hypothetical protein